MTTAISPVGKPQRWPTTPPDTMEEALDFMLAALPMFTRIGAAALKPGLDNILRMSAAIGNPHLKFKSIHVAGTNGKGSTSHSLAAILQSAGYTVGLHTSPHLKHFNERIRVNGLPIDDEAILDFIRQHWALWEEVRPSFFEYGVLLAFDTFAKAGVDIAVIEVGLGGRLDSTNILEPILSVITNISLDHTDLLGHTVGQIAAEKAGIIKPNTPVVIGEFDQESLPAFTQAATRQAAEMVIAADALEVIKTDTNQHYQINYLPAHAPWLADLYFELGGDYQLPNLRTILTATLKLRALGFSINDQAIRIGLGQCTTLTGLKGRWQVLRHSPMVIADTGHNVAGITYIANQLNRLVSEAQVQHNDAQLHVVFGMVADKDVKQVLTLLPITAHYYFCQAPIPRALAADLLGEIATEVGLKGVVIPSVNEALSAALSHAKPQDIVFVGGSTYVVADLDLL